MKNLESIKLVELNPIEQREINGGLVCGGVCVFMIALAVGAIIGAPVLATTPRR